MSDRVADQLARTVRAAVRRVARPTADVDLLDAFHRTRDPAAFAGLVQRHGPLVLAACRTILPNAADADDACQAAFVVLHRKAHTIRDGRTLGGWLFRVARRTALEVKATSARRREREARAARPEPVSAPDLSWREACAILHEELDRLPPRYRLPLILCYLEGKTRDEAAAALGWTSDSVRGRVNRGRERLRKLLEKRGVTLSAGLLAAVAVPAGVPTSMFAAVVCPSPTVAAVAQAVAATTRAFPIGSGLVLAAGLLVGAVVLGSGPGAPPPADPPAKKNPIEAVQSKQRGDSLGDPLPEGAIARLGTLRLNHGDGLSVLLFTPDGKSIVSVGHGQARVWDAATGVERLQFSTGTPEWDDQPVVSADGKQMTHLVQRFGGDPLHVFDLETGKELRSDELKREKGKRTEISVYRRNAMSPDGQVAVLHLPNAVVSFDIATGKELYGINFKDPREVKSIAFASPDRLVATYGKQWIGIYDGKTGEQKLFFQTAGPVGLIAGSLDGKLFATLEHLQDDIDHTKTTDTVRIWDLATGKKLHEITSRPGRFFMGVGFSNDGKAMYAFSTGRAGREVTIWDTATGKVITEIQASFGQAIALSPDGKRLAAGDNSGKFDVWNLGTGKPLAPAEATASVGSVFLSRDGSRVTTIGRTLITNWNATNGELLSSTVLPDHVNEPPACQFSGAGRYANLILRGDKETSIRVWDVAAGKSIQTIPIADVPFRSTVAVTPDSTRLAVLLDGKPQTVSIRDAKTGKELTSFKLDEPEGPGKLHLAPGKLYFIDDGRTLVVTGHRTIGYSIPEGTKRFAWTLNIEPDDSGLLRPGDSLVLSPDGSLAACIASIGWKPEDRAADQIALFDGRTGKVVRHLGSKHTHGYHRITFSADGRLLAAADGNDVRIWETATGKELRSYSGHRNFIETLSFSGNGRRLASASHDSTVLIWDLTAGMKNTFTDAWADLLSPDAITAYAAIFRLSEAVVDDTLPLLRKNLRALTPAEADRMRQWIADLNSDQFRIRDKAFKELAELGPLAGTALQSAMAKKPSAETANRIEQLQAKLIGPPSTGEVLRTWRALAVLEMKSTPSAIAFLKELAAGDADGWLTAEAKASLRRIAAMTHD
ncbi:MAG TPA: sigma-70 family RNA polymerase sigma factor [Gemmataceae bacterium]|nr:sigma-70 family RNA polymerase sigma factor [Gemmataceae bacterium]